MDEECLSFRTIEPVPPERFGDDAARRACSFRDREFELIDVPIRRLRRQRTQPNFGPDMESAHVRLRHRCCASLRPDTHFNTDRNDSGRCKDPDTKRDRTSNRHGSPVHAYKWMEGQGVSPSDRHEPLQLLDPIPDNNDLRASGHLRVIDVLEHQEAAV